MLEANARAFFGGFGEGIGEVSAVPFILLSKGADEACRASQLIAHTIWQATSCVVMAFSSRLLK